MALPQDGSQPRPRVVRNVVLWDFYMSLDTGSSEGFRSVDRESRRSTSLICSNGLRSRAVSKNLFLGS